MHFRRWKLSSKPRFDFQDMQSNKRRELERLSDTYKSNLEKAEVAFLEGRGKLLDKNTVEVNGKHYMVSHLSMLQRSFIIFFLQSLIGLPAFLPQRTQL